MIHNHTFEVGGKTISLETGRVAKQAGGAVLLGMGQTVVLGTATMSKAAREGIDFLPLVCDFEERKYAIGKIPGGFIKRGGRPSDKAVLVSRLIDRPIRPLFPKGMRNDVQVITMAFSVDKHCPPDVLAVNAAGAALAVSDVPFAGPIGAVRVGLIDGEFVLFPSNQELQASKLDLVVAGHKGAISMVEAGADEVDEKTMAEALKFAHKAIVQICTEFEKFAKKAGKSKRDYISAKPDEKLVDEIAKKEAKAIAAGIFDPDKAARESASDELAKELTAKYKEKYPDREGEIAGAVDSAIKATIRKAVIEDGKRPDGRKTTEIRPLEAMTGLIPRVHGSGLFSRGQTQVLTICTLGMPKDARNLGTLDEEGAASASCASKAARRTRWARSFTLCGGRARARRALVRRQTLWPPPPRCALPSACARLPRKARAWTRFTNYTPTTLCRSRPLRCQGAGRPGHRGQVRADRGPSSVRRFDRSPWRGRRQAASPRRPVHRRAVARLHVQGRPDGGPTDRHAGDGAVHREGRENQRSQVLLHRGRRGVGLARRSGRHTLPSGVRPRTGSG
jgi:ribonuclease PH